MDLAAISASPVGKLVAIRWLDPWQGGIHDHQTFVPDPLPVELGALELSGATWSVVVGAGSALAKLDQAGSQVPNPDLLRRPALRREAQSTSALEGTYAAFTDLLEADLDERRQVRSAEVHEVLNYVDAAEKAFEWIADRPITRGLLGQLQQPLVRETRGELPDAGKL